MEKLHVKKDDTVVVISGNSKGVRGKVIATSPEEGKVIVAGANIVSKHTKLAVRARLLRSLRPKAQSTRARFSFTAPSVKRLAVPRLHS